MVLALILLQAADLLVADFESEDYGAWTVEGEAFGPGPARGTLPNQMHVDGFLGKGLVNSFFKGDDTKGTLTSPAFTIERRYLNFLIGGGKHEGKAGMDLLVDGAVVRTATGPNDKAGGTERLDWRTWDVADLKGRSVRLRIADQVAGGWGHINIDHVVQSDTRAETTVEERRRELTVEGPYLKLPVKNKGPARRMTFTLDGALVRDFDIELADGEPDLWIYTDVSAFRGRKLRIEVDRIASGSKGLSSIAPANELPEAYGEALRPQFHFTARRGWLNDPNGMVYAGGQWHLYFQHNPYGIEWGNMHWGHAVSEDLFHWKELPLALTPVRHGDWAFSGSAVVDRENTSGWGKGAIVLAYTSTGRGECMAFSSDGGVTWREFEGNPVVRHAGRDPRLLWHAPTKRWVMAVYDEGEGRRAIDFHTSPDLKTWTFRSRIDGFYECPDLFPLMHEGKERWILYAADGEYMIGDFDGERFVRESGKHKLWYGDFYAAQTFSDAPGGRRVQIGWGRGITFPGMPFNQQMVVPVELTLRAGPRMFAEPVRELATLRTTGESDLMEIQATFSDPRAEAGIVARGVKVLWSPEKKELRCGKVTAPLATLKSLQVLVDRGSVEVFANGGEVALSVAVIPTGRGHEAIGAASSEAHALRSAW